MISTAPPPARATIASRAVVVVDRLIVVTAVIVDCLVVDTAITGITPRARCAPHRTDPRTLTAFDAPTCDDDDTDAMDARFSNRIVVVAMDDVVVFPPAGVAIAAIVRGIVSLARRHRVVDHTYVRAVV